LKGDLGELLRRWNEGDTSALDELVPLVYPRLRAIAGSFFLRPGQGQNDPTLQPTALVHEAYLRLLHQERVSWEDREHFFTFAARVMRSILVDHLRARESFKRGGAVARIPLHEEIPWVSLNPEDLADLNTALDELQEIDPPKVRLIELRYILGCTAEETSDLLGKSKATVDREMRLARAWLFRRLKGD
jgi:RNA polymerase sigma factor (TIGR02999 family)